MADNLNNIFGKLKSIRENLVKLNQSRRTPEVLGTRYNEASQVYAEYIKCSGIIDEQISKEEIKGSDIIEVKEICIRINTIFTQIQEFCSVNKTSKENRNGEV